MNRQQLTTGLMLAATLVLSGCGGFLSSINTKMPWYTANSVDAIGVYVDNSKTAIPIHVVYAYGDASLAIVSNVTAEQWFSQKKGYCAFYRDEIDILSMEVVSRYSAKILKQPKDHKDAIAFIVFARIPGADVTKIDISTLETPWILVDNKDLSAQSEVPSDIRAEIGKQHEFDTGVEKLC